MGMQDGAGRLNKAMRELIVRWEETRASWDDPVSRGFEERYLAPLQMDLKMATVAMGQMAQLLDRIRRDCT